MVNPKISETMACAKCNEQKPWPSDFITSFKKGTTESSCAACRAIRRKESRLKSMGKSELDKGWRNLENNFRRRANAIFIRVRKEREE